MAEAVVSPPAPGAGRSLHWMWPDDGAGYAVTSAGGDGTARPSPASVPGFSGGGWQSTGTSAVAGVVQEGAPALRVTPAVTSQIAGYGMRVPMPVVRSLRAQHRVQDSRRCYAIRAVMATDLAVDHSNPPEFGITVTHGVQARIMAAGGVTNPRGIYFGVLRPDAIGFRIRQADGTSLVPPGLMTYEAVSGITLDTARWFEIELRIIGATEAADAYVQGYMGGRPATERLYYGAGSVLPDWGFAGAGTNVAVNLYRAAGYPEDVNYYLQSVTVIAAPDEGSLD